MPFDGVELEIFVGLVLAAAIVAAAWICQIIADSNAALAQLEQELRTRKSNAAPVFALPALEVSTGTGPDVYARPLRETVRRRA